MTAVVTKIVHVPRKNFLSLAYILEAKGEHILTMCVGQLLKLGRAFAPEQGALVDISTWGEKRKIGQNLHLPEHELNTFLHIKV